MEYVISSEGVCISVLVPNGVADAIPGGRGSCEYARWVGAFVRELSGADGTGAFSDSCVREVGGACWAAGGRMLLGAGDGAEHGKVGPVDAEGDCSACVSRGVVRDAAVGVVGDAAGDPKPVEPRGTVGTAEDGRESGGAKLDGSVGVGARGAVSAQDPLAGLTGRRRRKKKKLLKAASLAQGEPTLGGSICGESASDVVSEAKEAVVQSKVQCESSVPEWRRKDVKATLHKGYFSECSPEVQRELKESRAQMMIARNRAAVAKAKEEAVRSEAAVKSRQVEQQAELRRLQTEAKLKKALESKFGVGMQSGFAETVVSNGLEEVCGTPSLSDGSVSPNSSISVCAVRKMEQTIKNLSEELRDVKQKYDVLSGAVKKGCAGKEKSEEDYDGPISEAEYRRNCDIMYGMRPGATKPMDAKYDELMVKMCAEGFSALGTEDLNELQAYGEFYG